MLRFAAFNALAYGAKGIVYWRFGLSTSHSNGEDTISFHDAPIVCGIPGNGLPEPVIIIKRPTLDLIKTVNREIHQIKSAFAGTTVVKCQHFPAYDSINKCSYEGVPYDAENQSSADEPYKHIGAEGAGVVVSHLQKGLSTTQVNYLLMVNKDCSNPQKISIVFYNTSPEIINAITEDTPSKSFIEHLNYTQYKATLSEGGIILFKWVSLKSRTQTKIDDQTITDTIEAGKVHKGDNKES